MKKEKKITGEYLVARGFNDLGLHEADGITTRLYEKEIGENILMRFYLNEKRGDAEVNIWGYKGPTTVVRILKDFCLLDDLRYAVEDYNRLVKEKKLWYLDLLDPNTLDIQK